MIKKTIYLLIVITLADCRLRIGNKLDDEEKRLERAELFSILALANSNRSFTLGSTRLFKSTLTNTVNGTPIAISFDSIVYDSNNIFSINDASRITIRSSGLYHILGQLSYATNGTGIRKVNLVLNDLAVIGSTAVPAATGDLTNVSTESIYRLSVGDFIRLQGFQSSGGSLDIAVNSGYSQVLSVTKISE